MFVCGAAVEGVLVMFLVAVASVRLDVPGKVRFIAS